MLFLAAAAVMFVLFVLWLLGRISSGMSHTESRDWYSSADAPVASTQYGHGKHGGSAHLGPNAGSWSGGADVHFDEYTGQAYVGDVAVYRHSDGWISGDGKSMWTD